MLVGCVGAKRFTAEGNFSKLWVSHPAPDALIHDSDPEPDAAGDWLFPPRRVEASQWHAVRPPLASNHRADWCLRDPACTNETVARR
ncbi:hypothetical protein NQZ68_033322 [Dissostichus eleginoides]|nr:hypothetical protein NQZ68_033322 [Dissostichus eleginoides]